MRWLKLAAAYSAIDPTYGPFTPRVYRQYAPSKNRQALVAFSARSLPCRISLERGATLTDQTVGQQIGQPGGVVDVGLAPGHVLDMHGVGQHQRKIAVAQDVPHRPSRPRSPPSRCGAALGGEPFRQCQQFLGGCLEGAHLALRAVDHVSHAGHDRLLVHVEASAMRIHNFHRPSCRSAPPGVGRRHKNSKDRAPEPLPALGALRGALAFRVRLKNGLSHTIEQPTSVPVAPGHATINVP